MQTFDRLKIVTAIDAIDVVDESVFAKTLVSGNVVSMKYYREMPTKLMIKVDYASGEVVVEFTGKILGHNYPHLISMANIEECFRNIESLGFCRFDMDLLMRSEVVSCDVAKDVQCSDVRKVQSYIRSHISNYSKYVCRALKNGNTVLEKNVTTRKNKKRMTIYDKEQEMKKSDNIRYMRKNGLTDEFVGKCRFEINLNSKEQIRNALHIEDTNLLTVLNSETNPILEFMDEAVCGSQGQKACSDWKSYQRYLVLKDCDFDLEKVEAKVRSLYKRGTKISDVMRPYREAYSQLMTEGEDTYFSEILAMLR
ncbi:MAG TPA: hypothetical protein IAC03_06180 [Candidatus Coprenecus pullistercoris]|nr:hypothetical protein [Candidatus Coprenecus pullistercoris]